MYEKDSELFLKKHHASTRIFKSYIHFLESHFPDIKIADLCSEAGLPYGYLLNQDNWVSIVFGKRFHNLCVAKTGLGDLAFRVGQVSLTEPVIGRALFSLLRHVLSLDLIYQRLPTLISLFNKSIRIKILKRDRGFVAYQIEKSALDLDPEEVEALREQFPNILQSTVGYLTTVPCLHGLAPATVEVERVIEGDFPCYRLHVRFTPSYPIIKTAAVLFSIPVCFWLAGLVPPGNESFTFGATFGAILFLCFLMLAILKIRKLKQGVDLTVKAFQGLDQRYSDLFRAKQDLKALIDAYSKFVPFEFLSLLGKKSILDVKLNDSCQGKITILFSDIRNYTSLSELLGPTETFKFVNTYLSRIPTVIRKHKGFVANFMGDGFMAIFPDSPNDALMAVNELMNDLQKLGKQSRVGMFHRIDVGIGINHANTVMGIIGNSTQMQASVIGDSVNTAARLQVLSKDYGCPIILSKDHFEQVNEEFKNLCRHLGRAYVKGKGQRIHIFEYFGWQMQERISERVKSRERFEKAIQLAEDGRTKEAQEIMIQIKEEFPGDRVAEVLSSQLGIISPILSGDDAA